MFLFILYSGNKLTQGDESDIGFLPGHKNYSFNVKISRTLVELTLCFWVSIKSLSPIKIKVDYVNVEKMKNVINIAFVKIHTTTRYINTKSKFCTD